VTTKEILVVFGITIILLLTSAEIIEIAKAAPKRCEVKTDSGWRPPNVSLCLNNKDTDLWDCIRQVQYRRDI